MKFILSGRALQQLSELDAVQKERIVSKLEFFASQPAPLSFGTRLVGYDLFRFRVGDWRILFEVRHDIVYILVIARRDQIYKEI